MRGGRWACSSTSACSKALRIAPLWPSTVIRSSAAVRGPSLLFWHHAARVSSGKLPSLTAINGCCNKLYKSSVDRIFFVGRRSSLCNCSGRSHPSCRAARTAVFSSKAACQVLVGIFWSCIQSLKVSSGTTSAKPNMSERLRISGGCVIQMRCIHPTTASKWILPAVAAGKIRWDKCWTSLAVAKRGGAARHNLSSCANVTVPPHTAWTALPAAKRCTNTSLRQASRQITDLSRVISSNCWTSLFFPWDSKTTKSAPKFCNIGLRCHCATRLMRLINMSFSGWS